MGANTPVGASTDWVQRQLLIQEALCTNFKIRPNNEETEGYRLDI
jgi:hypothetical protein